MTHPGGSVLHPGQRVIRASAQTRESHVLGTVLERRDRLVRVGFEDGTDRWVAPDLYRALGEPRKTPDYGALIDWELTPR